MSQEAETELEKERVINAALLLGLSAQTYDSEAYRWSFYYEGRYYNGYASKYAAAYGYLCTAGYRDIAKGFICEDTNRGGL